MAKISTNNFLILFLFAISYGGLLSGYWWVSILAAFIFGFLCKNNKKNIFLTSFLTIFFLYLFLGLLKEVKFEHSPALLVGDLLGSISSYLVFFLVGFIPAILSGLAALSGSLLKK